MENLKMETELKLETIFLSLNIDTINKLNDILNVKELEFQDKNTIKKFIAISQNMNKTPGLDILKKEFPDLYFDDSTKLSGEELDDYILLYIAHIKNIYISRQLLNLANTVRTNGIDSNVLSQLDLISKSDTVEIPYTNIGDSILDIYNKKKSEKGIDLAVSSINKDTRWFTSTGLLVLCLVLLEILKLLGL